MPTVHGGEIGQKSSFSGKEMRAVSQSLPMPSNKIRTIFVKPISLKFGPTLKPKPTMICSICGVAVTRIKKHMSRAHSEEKNKQSLLVAVKQAPNSQLCKCPYCVSFVRQDRLDVHIKKIHKIGTQGTQVSPKAPIRRKSQQAKHQQQATSGTDSSCENRSMDATRDYYARYRDNGQFGSHPSHDSFDDESAP